MTLTVLMSWHHLVAEERKPFLPTSASSLGSIAYHSLDSVLQCRTAIFCRVAEECLVLCLRSCVLGKLFSTILTFPVCNQNSTLTLDRHHGKEAYLNYGCFSRMTTLLRPQNVSKITTGN